MFGVPVRFIVCVVVVSSGCVALGRRADPTDEVTMARSRCQLGLVSLQSNRADDAERHFRQAISDCESDYRARAYLGELLWKDGRRQEAISQMKQAVRLSDSDAQPRVRLGEMYLLEGDDSAALRQADAALSVDHQLADAWALRASVLERKGNTTEALANVHRALAIRPGSNDLRLQLARMYVRLNLPRRALACLMAADEQTESQPPSLELLVLEGQALKDIGRFSEASVCFRRAHDLRPADSRLASEWAETVRLASVSDFGMPTDRRHGAISQSGPESVQIAEQTPFSRSLK